VSLLLEELLVEGGLCGYDMADEVLSNDFDAGEEKATDLVERHFP
jgi:hypothetical protein